MSFLKYFSKKIYFLKSERDYKTIRKKKFHKNRFPSCKKNIRKYAKKKTKKKVQTKIIITFEGFIA